MLVLIIQMKYKKKKRTTGIHYKLYNCLHIFLKPLVKYNNNKCENYTT